MWSCCNARIAASSMIGLDSFMSMQLRQAATPSAWRRHFPVFNHLCTFYIYSFILIYLQILSAAITGCHQLWWIPPTPRRWPANSGLQECSERDLLRLPGSQSAPGASAVEKFGLCIIYSIYNLRQNPAMCELWSQLCLESRQPRAEGPPAPGPRSARREVSSPSRNTERPRRGCCRDIWSVYYLHYIQIFARIPPRANCGRNCA